MKKLLVLLLLLLIAGLLALAYADTRARELAEDHAEAKVAEALPQLEGVHVTLDGFPFVLGVLMSGEVEALHVKIDRVTEAGLQAHDLSLHVYTIALDKDALIDEQRLVVTDIDHAAAEGFITDDEVSKLVKRTVTFSPGKVMATIKGVEVAVEAAVVDRTVQLKAPIPGVPPLVFPLPPADLLPCAPELELREGELRLSCSVNAIPDTLKQAMAQS